MPNPADQARGLALIINNPKIGLILVAKDANVVVGMVNLLFTVSTALGGKVALLEDMVVSSNDCGTGIGSQLLTQAISIARTHSCKRITLLTDRSNEAAQRFYMKQGFNASSMVPLRLSLP